MSANAGQTLWMRSMSMSPAMGTRVTDQKSVRMVMIAVMDQERKMRQFRGRYVFGHITSVGAGLGFANS